MVLDFPIGDIALRDTLMPLVSGLAVVDPLVVEEGDVPLAVVEAEGGAGSRLHWCKNYKSLAKIKMGVNKGRILKNPSYPYTKGSNNYEYRQM